MGTADRLISNYHYIILESFFQVQSVAKLVLTDTVLQSRFKQFESVRAVSYLFERATSLCLFHSALHG